MKNVYMFQEGNKEMKNILGGKGANLAEMTNLGLPVPNGFTITSSSCISYYENEGKILSDIVREILESVKKLEQNSGKTFGGGENPLLLSIRSGARASMPGMMDTILNLGLNDRVAKVLLEKTQNKRFVYDSYRRFIQMFADVVKNVPKQIFEEKINSYKTRKNISNDIDLDETDMENITADFKEIYKTQIGVEFPENPEQQLLEAVSAVFRSWNTERCVYYRKMNNIPDSWGTAVNVQEMVYGNIGELSGTGVAFSRNPATGENKLYGEYLMNAQGEDVVSGIRTPFPISHLEQTMPNIYQEFLNYAKILENHYRDMQDMEFTIENGKLFMLQTRNGKRTSAADIKIVVDLEAEKLITKEEALLRIEPKQLEDILHPMFSEETLKKAEKIATGLAASPGAASGYLCFNAKDVVKYQSDSKDCILVRNETSPEDIEGMNCALGILTKRGGMTSHAAVVARGMGRCCISGSDVVEIDEFKKTLTLKNGQILTENDKISLDGSTGFVYLGELPKTKNQDNKDVLTILSWADSIRRLKIFANADNEIDTLEAQKMGAEGIGLCRTEHMFFEKNRLFSFRKMILAETKEERIVALKEILPYQKSDFEKIFRIMAGKSVTIRYLDPPLHEFLPKKEEEIISLSNSLNKTVEEIKNRITELKETNPMMGLRGARLDITYPEIAEMQTTAIIDSAITVIQEGYQIEPEIMIPLIGDQKEFDYIKKIVLKTAETIMKEKNVVVKFKIGTMIEVPRACVLADEIAKSAEFFSFGTNDLTQMTYGFSRDDAEKFLKDYQTKKIMDFNPFETLDLKGVGTLMSIAIDIAKKTRPNIVLGICGEHAGDAKSIEFCNEIGLDYVSCSPYRISIAKLASAQAVLKNMVSEKNKMVE